MISSNHRLGRGGRGGCHPIPKRERFPRSAEVCEWRIGELLVVRIEVIFADSYTSVFHSRWCLESIHGGNRPTLSYRSLCGRIDSIYMISTWAFCWSVKGSIFPTSSFQRHMIVKSGLLFKGLTDSIRLSILHDTSRLDLSCKCGPIRPKIPPTGTLAALTRPWTGDRLPVGLALEWHTARINCTSLRIWPPRDPSYRYHNPDRAHGSQLPEDALSQPPEGALSKVTRKSKTSHTPARTRGRDHLTRLRHRHSPLVFDGLPLMVHRHSALSSLLPRNIYYTVL